MLPELEIQLVLILVALIAGVGITAIGPGGILLTISLHALTALPPPVVAGTASATFVVAGILGSATYLRSGELARLANRRLALWLSLSSMLGAVVGALVNPLFSRGQFGALLGLATILAGAVVLAQRVWGRPEAGADSATPVRAMGMVMLGVGLGFACALLGVGGPVFAVPALVLLGVPMLSAVAVAQVQSIFIAAFATAGYAVQGAVDWRLGVLVGIPLLIGVVGGWWVARRTDPSRLKIFLGVVLVAVGSYLLMR